MTPARCAPCPALLIKGCPHAPLHACLPMLLPCPGCPHAPPPEVYATLETMLPGEVASGSCLELWAAQGSARQGWTRVLELGAE